MSKSGVFAHFGSREELQISVIREYHARFEAEVFAPAMSAARGLPRLRTLFDQAAERAGMRPVSAAMQVLRQAGDLPMEQVVAIENALFAGERLPAAILPIARQALEAWVKEVAPELLSSEGEASS